MSRVRLYFDDDSSNGDVIRALKRAEIDAESTFTLGMYGRSDDSHLRFAAESGRVVVTANQADFARLHQLWLTDGRHHAGVLVVHQQRWTVGEQVRRLMLFVERRTAEEMRDWMEYLSAFS